MSLLSKVTVLKGSKQGIAVAATVPKRSTLENKEVALRITHSGVSPPVAEVTMISFIDTNEMNRSVGQTYTTSVRTWSLDMKGLVSSKLSAVQSPASNCACTLHRGSVFYLS